MDSIETYLAGTRQRVEEEIRALVPADSRHTGGLYQMMLDYPLRHGKSLRPAIALACCRALGGSEAAVMPTAAVLELYHNAFLIHDDVEDRSEKRRHEPTLNRKHGVPLAINVGDGMLAIVMRPLLDNTRTIGLGRALRVLDVVARMARETAEGQAMELGWIADGYMPRRLCEYTRLVHKKTSWYSFIAPLLAAATIAGLDRHGAQRVGRLGVPLGVAFQIQDDVLNLSAASDTYGKDGDGDLWEGKRTLILMHAIDSADPAERAHACAVVAKPVGNGEERYARNAADVEFLRKLIARHDSIGYAQRIARRYARRFEADLHALARNWADSPHKQFLFALARYTVGRTA
jgi:geranylgeranyl diphosphate synthase type II